MENNTFNTSLNQVPAIIKEYRDVLPETILNYGCGCGYRKVEAYLEHGVTSYDKYSNEEAIRKLDRSKDYECVVCANVLNVIETEKEMNEMLKDIASLSDTALFSVYEGNGTGVGNPTSKGYQRNQKAKEYEGILKRYFSSVVRKGKNFICNK